MCPPPPITSVCARPRPEVRSGASLRRPGQVTRPSPSRKLRDAKALRHRRQHRLPTMSPPPDIAIRLPAAQSQHTVRSLHHTYIRTSLVCRSAGRSPTRSTSPNQQGLLATAGLHGRRMNCRSCYLDLRGQNLASFSLIYHDPLLRCSAPAASASFTWFFFGLVPGAKPPVPQSLEQVLGSCYRNKHSTLRLNSANSSPKILYPRLSLLRIFIWDNIYFPSLLLIYHEPLLRCSAPAASASFPWFFSCCVRGSKPPPGSQLLGTSRASQDTKFYIPNPCAEPVRLLSRWVFLREFSLMIPSRPTCSTSHVPIRQQRRGKISCKSPELATVPPPHEIQDNP
nr:hypothetical protein CFP56_09671 [Quercus suber]